MKIPSSAKDLFTRYVETCALANQLEREKADLKAAIIAHMGDERALEESGFAVKLTPGVRKTANQALIERAMGIKLTDACFKVTSYDSLSVTPLKA